MIRDWEMKQIWYWIWFGQWKLYGALFTYVQLVEHAIQLTKCRVVYYRCLYKVRNYLGIHSERLL